MTVKPHEKLVDNKKNKNSVRDETCNSQRNNSESKVNIQEIFLFNKALNPCSERFDNMIFFKIIKLINDSTGKYGKNGTENDPVNFKIKNKISERFFLIKKEKCRNV